MGVSASIMASVRLSGLELGVSGPSVDEVTRVDTCTADDGWL